MDQSETVACASCGSRALRVPIETVFRKIKKDVGCGLWAGAEAEQTTPHPAFLRSRSLLEMMQRRRRARGCSLGGGGVGARPAHVGRPPMLRPIRALKLHSPPPRLSQVPPSSRHSKGSKRRTGGAPPRPRGVRPSANPVSWQLPVPANRSGSRRWRRGLSVLHSVQASG